MIPELPPPTLVQDARGLSRLLDDLDGQREIAFDTEADSFFSYREKVCLVQITVEQRDYLVDPLGGLDLSPLGRVLADPNKTKVFHDGEYDVLILKRAWGFDFAGMFDTRVAASAMGEANPGLASVLKAHFDLDLDKSMQRSDWSARPLTERQIRYAQLDTHFLVGLMHRQRADLAARGRAAVVEGECRRLEQLVPPEAGFDPDDFVRVKGLRTLDKQAQQNLRELFIVRDGLARQADLPPFKVLSTQVLLDLARTPPSHASALASMPGISQRIARRNADEILGALARARELGPLRRLPSGPRQEGPRLDELDFELHERLKTWRKERAQKEGFDASLVLNRHVLTRLALEKPRDVQALARIEGIAPWQVELFGEDLVRSLQRALEDIQRDGLPKRGRRGWARGH